MAGMTCEIFHYFHCYLYCFVKVLLNLMIQLTVFPSTKFDYLIASQSSLCNIASS